MSRKKRGNSKVCRPFKITQKNKSLKIDSCIQDTCKTSLEMKPSILGLNIGDIVSTVPAPAIIPDKQLTPHLTANTPDTPSNYKHSIAARNQV